MLLNEKYKTDDKKKKIKITCIFLQINKFVYTKVQMYTGINEEREITKKRHK